MTKSPRTNRRPRAKSETGARLHFLGATRTVTGSLLFFEVTNEKQTIRFFLDAGLVQEHGAQNLQNRLPSGVKPADVNFGIFSHAHIDHTGFFPRLVKDGFKGTVYTTSATAELTGLLLPDSGFLQEEEAKRRSKKQKLICADAAKDKRKVKGCEPGTGAPTAAVEPLYNEAEARASLKHIRGVDFDKRHEIMPGIAVTFTKASHILGAAVVTLELGTGSKKRRVVFSGDLGRPGMPILQDLAPVKHADYLICEGTYGNRKHVKRNRLKALAEVINAAYERAQHSDKKFGHGVIIIPAFAVGRVQSVLYDLRQLMADKLIPAIPVFVDSPMAIKANAIYRKNQALYNKAAAAVVADGTDLLKTPEYAELESWQESMTLDAPPNRPCIVVGSSGMANGGRIVRHLQQRLGGKQNTVVFIGYQGFGTLGRQIVTPEVDEVKIAGVPVKVRATVVHMEDYSGHADFEDITRWLRGFQTKPKQMFLVHGDEAALETFKEHIEQTLRWDVTIPQNRDHFDLE